MYQRYNVLQVNVAIYMILRRLCQRTKHFYEIYRVNCYILQSQAWHINNLWLIFFKLLGVRVWKLLTGVFLYRVYFQRFMSTIVGKPVIEIMSG